MVSPWRQTNDNAPCARCTEREVGCHSKCEKYIAYTKERRKVSERRNKDEDVDNWQYGSIYKNKKRSHRR